MSVSNQVITGSIWSSGARILTAFFRIALLFVLSRLLNPEDFGLFQVVTTVFLYISTLSNLGLGSAIVQKKDLEPLHLHSAFWAYLVLGALGSILLFILAPWIAIFFKQDNLTAALRVIAFLPLAHTISAVSRSLLLKELKIKKLSVVETVSYLLGYIPITLILAFAGYGYWSLIAGFIVQSLVLVALSFWAYPFKPLFQFSFSKFRDLFRFGAYDTFNGFVGMSVNQADTFFIGRFMSPASLGIYNRAYNLMSANVSLFSDFIDRIFFAGFSKKQDDDESLLRAFYKADFLITALMIPLSLFCFVSAEDLIVVLMGEKWIAATAAFQILSLGLVFRLNHKISSSILRAKGAMKDTSLLILVTLVFILILMFFLKDFGIEGIALAFLLSTIYRYVHLLFLLKKHIGAFRFFELFRKNAGTIFLGLVFMAASLAARSYLPDESRLVNLLIGLILALVIFSPLMMHPVVKELYRSFPLFKNFRSIRESLSGRP